MNISRRVFAFISLITLLSLSFSFYLNSGMAAARAQTPETAHERARRVHEVTPPPQTATPQPSPTVRQPTMPPALPPPSTDDEVVRVETNLVDILFNAVDKNRRFVTTLKQDDIRVFEDNVPQTVSQFQRETELPLSLALLIDVSRSQEHTLPDEKDAAHIFVNSMVRPQTDNAAVISFHGFATVEQDLTNNLASLQRAIDRVQIVVPPPEPEIIGTGATPEAAQADAEAQAATIDSRGRSVLGSTAIWDAIWATSNEIMAHTPERTRRAIILLSDGFEDSDSSLKLQDAVEAAVKANTVVYAIGIGDEDFDANALKKIAERTGGRAFFPKDEAELNANFAQIQQELRTQYLVSYSPTNKAHDGTFRQVRIEVTNPELRKDKLRLTYRQGYFANPNAPAFIKPARMNGQRLPKPARRPKK